MASKAFAQVDRLLCGAFETRFTACVARIEHRGAVVYERAFGTTRLDRDVRDAFVDTRFDIASITKLFVATLALRLVADGLVALDEPLMRVFPSWREDERSQITLRMLLAHTSGMHSGADYRTILDENVERFALERALASAPGSRVTYSDLGFIAVGTAIERLTGRSLAASMRELIASPTLAYRPSARERPSIPATEEDAWRGRVQGRVHDEKCYLMGGVAGHAGLFGTAADVARLTEAFLAAACGRRSPLVPPELAREAIREQAFDPVLRRGLGWALKTSDANSCGKTMDRSSFGHTGFVGTCVWADPVRDAQGVLLTNAVYFGRSDTRELRAAFYDAAMAALPQLAGDRA